MTYTEQAEIVIANIRSSFVGLGCEVQEARYSITAESKVELILPPPAVCDEEILTDQNACELLYEECTVIIVRAPPPGHSSRYRAGRECDCV